MPRLTHKTPNVPAVPVNFALDFVFNLDDETWHGLSAIFERLDEYEDTGKTPAEIVEMRDELERIYTALA
jgi:hypothetical protein